MNNNSIPQTRLLSLDVMRGITIAGMIMVNNPGSWEHIYAPLKHAAWNGLTPTDLVFPFFMFIMGISCYASLKKYDFKPSKEVVSKILKRTFKIFVVGLVLAWFGLSFSTYRHLADQDMPFFNHLLHSVTNFQNLRILGVLQRLALCYGIASLIIVFVRNRYIPYLIAGGLIGYFLILLFGNGFEPGELNILGIVDRFVIGESHMYIDMDIEPEGLLGTIPSVCHVLIGFCCGKIIMGLKDNKDRMLNLFLLGIVLLFVGLLLSYGCPINKKIWSPTYVLVTCGLGTLLLSLLIWIIDVKGHKSWSRFFETFGVNPLAIYVFAGILATLVEGLSISSVSFKEIFYVGLTSFMEVHFASLIYALLFIAVCWSVGYVLYRKKIYIKL